MTYWTYPMRKAKLFLLCIIAVMALSAPARALDLAPFPVRNMSPVVQIFGLPPAAPARLAAPGATEAALGIDIASHHTSERRTREQVSFDGESYRFALALRHGLRDGVEVGAEIPYVLHHRGFLDGFIIGWHDFFGLPQSGRDDAPRDRLLFTYTDNGRERLRLDESADGLGDVRLTGAWQMRRSERGGAALRASLKLPTGDSDRLLGSGSTDLALSVDAEQGYVVGDQELALFGAAGAMLLTDGDVLPDRQRNVVGFGTLGGAWRPLSWLAFKLQVDAHTAFFGSEVQQLGESVQLTVGGALDFGATTLDIGVVEDILVDTAPDVTFLIALRHAF